MIRKYVAGAALVGTMVVGAASGAFAAGTTDPSVPKDPAAAAAAKEAKCAKAPELIARIKANQEKRAAAITKLQDAEAKATAEGKTEKVTKIQARIAKVKAHADKATARLAKIAERCPQPAA
jgi:hypothetical protein